MPQSRLTSSWSIMSRVFSLVIVLVLAALWAPLLHAQTTYAFDASQSSLEINVYKEGLFSALGHDHLIQTRNFAGAIQFDPQQIDSSSVALRVQSSSLTVVDPGVSPSDREQIQATMQSATVLDSAHYLEISFHSTRVTEAKHDGSRWHLMLTGILQLHGTKRSVALPLTVSAANGNLEAHGDAYILQTDFGITPIKVAGGAVKVKNRLRIHFDIHAQQRK